MTQTCEPIIFVTVVSLSSSSCHEACFQVTAFCLPCAGSRFCGPALWSSWVLSSVGYTISAPTSVVIVWFFVGAVVYSSGRCSAHYYVLLVSAGLFSIEHGYIF